MKWEVVKLSGATRGRKSPTVSVGFGHMSFNASACSLIPNQEEYPYARILKGKDSSGKNALESSY